jgi:peptide chain release factor 1
LLSRARSIAKEHDKISQLLGETFDSKLAKRMGELAPVAQAVKDWDKTHEVRAHPWFTGRKEKT